MDLSKLRAASAKRMVNGVEVPRQNTTSSGVRAAMKVGGKNYAGESGEVEGEASRPRLDRPARRNGGCVDRKAGGGSVMDKISDAISFRDDSASKQALGNMVDAAKAGAAGMGGAGRMMRGAAESGAFKDFVKKAGQSAGEAMNSVRNVAPSMGRKSGGKVGK